MSRRRMLALAAATGAGLGGCQALDDTGSGVEETVTPATVPGETITLRHDAGRSPATAIEELIETFEAEHGGDVVESPIDGRPGETGDGPTVRYDRIGANLAPRAQQFRDLAELWAGERDAHPYGVTVSCFVARSFLAVPQTVHRMNCLYYNPTTLSDAGVSVEDYTTISDLRASPGSLADAVETLFAQPLRSSTETLALWESLLGGRLYRARQYHGYVVGDVPNDPPPIRRSLRDLDAALSMLPDGASETSPEALLDGVVDGRIGFVRQPTWAGRHLIEREDATYGSDWAVAPVFASPWAVTFVADGFAVSSGSIGTGEARDLVRFATSPERQRQFCATAGAIPARTDVTVDAHPMVVEQATDYREASMYLPSMAHGIAVRPPVRRRLERALSSFRRHRNVDRGVGDLVAALRTAEVL